MKKRKILVLVFGFVTLMFIAFVITSCDLEKLYTCNNRSSYSVTVTDSKGSGIVIPSGGTKSIYLVDNATLYDIYYSPADLVSVSVIGQTITFRDR